MNRSNFPSPINFESLLTNKNFGEKDLVSKNIPKHTMITPTIGSKTGIKCLILFPKNIMEIPINVYKKSMPKAGCTPLINPSLIKCNPFFP